MSAANINESVDAIPEFIRANVEPSAVHNKRAQREMRVPTEASAYSFRHARISELLQLYGVDPLTVAAQTGTSLRMIERSYFKFIRSAMLEKLAGLKAKPAGE